MKIAATAASGQLGSEFVKACVALVGTENVIALARTVAKALHLGVEVRPGDYDDRAPLTESLRSILDEADVRRFACVVATRRPLVLARKPLPTQARALRSCTPGYLDNGALPFTGSRISGHASLPHRTPGYLDSAGPHPARDDWSPHRAGEPCRRRDLVPLC